jgi:hypothetical protein
MPARIGRFIFICSAHLGVGQPAHAAQNNPWAMNDLLAWKALGLRFGRIDPGAVLFARMGHFAGLALSQLCHKFVKSVSTQCLAVSAPVRASRRDIWKSRIGDFFSGCEAEMAW